MNKRTREEYGGFLPLELNPGKEWFNDYGKKLQRFNSVKAAIVHVIQRVNISEIYIPYYYCPSTIKAIQNTGIKVKFYHIDHFMHPMDLPDINGTAVILVNYFGLLDDYVLEKAMELTSAYVFIDNAHAFFCKPLLRQNTYNFYSPKKFIGVPDGAYLIGEDVQIEEEQAEYASDYSHYLLLAYEQGTNAAYQEKKKTDVLIGEHYAGMSKLAKGILQNTDYNRVMKARMSNFEAFRSALQSKNILQIDQSCPAYLFPLLIKNGKAVKKVLINKRIFVPTLWLGKELLDNGNEFEIAMSSDAIFLPIDQRYNLPDILFLISVIEELNNENTNI